MKESEQLNHKILPIVNQSEWKMKYSKKVDEYCRYNERKKENK